ncbi:MAG TPA: hypothetical protein VKR29_04290 [Candidatus Binataceae bacterium]|nr:hypothetical protein [Candidatus Binataceae bacterium]
MSDLGSLTPIDLKTRVVAADTSREIVENARHRWIFAQRTMETSFTLAIGPSLGAVRDLIQRKRRFYIESHGGSWRHQQAPKYKRCGRHARRLARGLFQDDHWVHDAGEWKKKLSILRRDT